MYQIYIFSAVYNLAGGVAATSQIATFSTMQRAEDAFAAITTAGGSHTAAIRLYKVAETKRTLRGSNDETKNDQE